MNEVKLKALLVHVTNKLADGQARGRTGLLHEFVFSRFFRESGATVMCEACEQFYDLADIYIDGTRPCTATCPGQFTMASGLRKCRCWRC